VNGSGTHPIYRFLRSAILKNQKASKNRIEWNYAKFIVSKEGQVTHRYGPNVDPEVFDVPSRLPSWLGLDASTTAAAAPTLNFAAPKGKGC
jgi:hypothetical protein